MSMRRRPAMTLLEVLIAITLITMLLASLLTFFVQTTDVRERVRSDSARTRLVQNVFDRLRREFESTVAADTFAFPELQQFSGDRRSITFVTTPLPPDSSYAFAREAEWASGPAPRHDLRQITYQLWVDQEEDTEEGEPLVLGVLRTERRALDPVETQEDVAEGQDLKYIRHDLWAPELGYLEFRYYDGVQWSTTWNVPQGNRLPHLIQITVGFDSLLRDELEDQDLSEYPLEEYPLGPPTPSVNRFTTLVRLPAADEMFSARLSRLGDDVEEVYQSGGTEDGEGEEQ